MFLEFATKRDRNGNRYYLTIETEGKIFTLMDRYYIKGEFIQITRTERRKLIEELKAHNFEEKEYF